MKRREFLISGAGIAVGGLAIPGLSQAQTKPCPPSPISVAGGTAAKVSCEPGQGAPDWFVKQAEGTWRAVAGNAGQRIVDASVGQLALSTPTPAVSLSTRAWTGGCVDQERGELLFAANGGHADYGGNEVYACRIRATAPTWYRLVDRSPEEVVGPVLQRDTRSTSNSPTGQGNTPDGYAAMFLDGRMRAVHGYCSATFANGKVWYHHQSSPSGVGNSAPHAWSFDRNFAGVPTSPGQGSLAWTRDPGPWRWLGRTSDGVAQRADDMNALGISPPSALDPVSGRIWTIHEYSASRLWSSLDTQTGTIRRCNRIDTFARPTGNRTWAAVVVDPSGNDRWRLLVSLASDAKCLVVLNLKARDPYDASAWSVAAVSDFALLSSAGGANGVYHRATGSILIGTPRTLGRTILRLRVPTTSAGDYVPDATWEVSSLTVADGSADPAVGMSSGNAGSYSKFNIIEDMGDGRAALVVCMEIDAPTYVYKLPLSL